MGQQPCARSSASARPNTSGRDDVSMAGLVREAAIRALDDAEMTWADIDAVVIGKAPDIFEGVMMPELYLADALGAAGKPMIRVHTAGQRRRLDRDRRRAPHRGRASTSACSRSRSRSSPRATRTCALSRPACRSPAASAPAATSRRYIRAYIERSGAPDDIGPMVAVKDRLQRAARTRTRTCKIPDITIEKVKESPMVWDPIRRLESCPTSDGAVRDGAHRRGRRPKRATGRRRRGCTARAMRSRAVDVPRPRPGEPAGRPGLRRRRLPRRPASPTRARRSTAPRSTCRSAGTSRCGWRTSASPARARAGRWPRPASPRSTATFPVNCRAACCRRTRSARRACSGSPRPRMQVRGTAGEHQVDGARRRARPRLRRRLAVLRHVGRRFGTSLGDRAAARGSELTLLTSGRCTASLRRRGRHRARGRCWPPASVGRSRTSGSGERRSSRASASGRRSG